MGLNGRALPIVLGAIALALLAFIVLGKPALRRRPARMAARGAMSVLFTLTVLALVGALFNNEYAFYTSWGDLLGSPPEVAPTQYGSTPTQATSREIGQDFPRATTTPDALPALPDAGQRVQKYTIPGPTGTTGARKVFVRLPKGYDPASAQRYPVIVALHGLPGSPESYNNLGNFYAKVDAAAAAGVMREPIVVVPQLNSSAHADSECIDAPGGAQTETWLARTLPQWVLAHFRAEPKRTAWATWGYSFGGWCATMLAMRHPGTYGAAVAYQGYFRPQFEGRPPFAPTSALATGYDLVALEKRDAPPVALWVFASKADPESYPTTREFLAAVRAPTSVTSRLTNGGGHRLSVWTRKIPTSFVWLGQVQPGFAANGAKQLAAEGTSP